MLSKGTKLLKEQAEDALSTIEQTIEGVKSKAGQQSEKGKEKINEYTEKAKAKFENSLRGFFSKVDRPELDYEKIKTDMNNIMHDPKATREITSHRLESFNHDTLVAVVSANKRISEEDAEKVISKIEDTREKVIQKAEKIQAEVEKRVKEARDKVLEESNKLRKATIAASWWIFATAVISGLASVLGGVLAYSF